MVTDEEIIARASGGLALCGIHIGDSEEQSQRPVKQLLRPPEHCNLKNSDQGYEMRNRFWSSIQASETFSEKVKSFGWSAALNLYANAFGFNIDIFQAGVGREKLKQMSQSSQDVIKEACHMQIWYCPKASFAIPPHEMQLTEEALNDARCVQNIADAKKFLSNYNSHVSTGTYHVGGVLMKSLLLRAETAKGLEKLLEKVSKGASLGSGVFAIGGNASVGDGSGKSLSKKKASHVANVQHTYTALGPKTDDEADFKTQLHHDRETWDIIDIVNNPDLVPIWEIPSVKSSRDLQVCCELLRQAWQESVRCLGAERHDSRAYLLLQASHMANVKSLLASSKASTDTRELKDILRNIRLEKTENLDGQRVRDLFQLRDFHNLLLRVAESTGGDPFDDEVEGGPALVCSIVTLSELHKLEDEGIQLPTFLKALHSDQHKHSVECLRPLEDMSLGGLIDRLKQLLGEPSHAGVVGLQISGTLATVPAFDSKVIEKAIRNFLRESQDDDLVPGVRKLIRKFGFDKSGNIHDGRLVTREEMNSLVNDLELLLNGVYDAPPKHLPRVQEVPLGYVKPPNLATFLGCNQTQLKKLGIGIVYNQHLLVDRPNDISSDPQRQMMDRLRHRLDPFASTSRRSDKLSRRRHMVAAQLKRGDDIVAAHPAPSASPLEILVQLLTRADLLVQTALLQLLLDARIGIPLVVPVTTISEEGNSLAHLAEALDLVQVKLARQEILWISKDIKLPRVVFVSNKKSASQRETSHMASQVMNIQLPSKFVKDDGGDGLTVIEFGVGFLQDSESEPRDHQPCLVFCVWGDHSLLGAFLARVADFIIVEIDRSEEASSLPWTEGPAEEHIRYWKSDAKGEGETTESFCTFCGTFNQIAEDLEYYLLECIVDQKMFRGASEGGAETLDESLTSICPFNKKMPAFDLRKLQRIDFEKAKTSLQLQTSFAKEADSYYKARKQRGEKSSFDEKRRILQEERKRLAPKMQALPLLQTFISTLSLEHYVERNIAIVSFELMIQRKLHSTLKRASEEETQAFDLSQQNEGDQRFMAAYILARKEHINKKLGLEHLWRELSHIFVANPTLRYLPQLAAKHLMDGFPLEILDGDASLFNSLWVETVLTELHIVLSASLKYKPKVFVLSIIGLQSSGKSTLLNVMFGTKLKTSAGQCTRGVYLQLIKSERKEFDYVLLLDTEGIRSPEFYQQENAEFHDNLLATFAVLPADACIVMVANEEDSGLKEVLPMVMLAFKDSAMAQKCAGRKQAKVFFAYRSVDTNDVSKLGNNQRKLQEDLRKASREAYPELNHVGGTLLVDFRVSNKEEESDVKYFGTLKNSNVPPGDTPDWEYGTKVESLREYIHKRITDDGNWKARELQSWREHLKLVWECIGDANFEISFRSQVEHREYHLLQNELVACRQKVGKKWMEEFENLTRTMQVQGGTGQQHSQWTSLTHEVQPTLDESEAKVTEILDQPQWQRWKLDEWTIWKKFRANQESDWHRRLEESFATLVNFDNVVKYYNAKIQQEINDKTGKFDDLRSSCREERMMTEFEEIFQRILQDAKDKYRPMAEDVPSNVARVYDESMVTGRRFDFSKEEQNATGQTLWARVFRKDCAAQRLNRVRDALKARVELDLQDAKQYADHLVEQMIKFTEKAAREAGLDKKEEGTMHVGVRQLLTDKLLIIQKKWDKSHNVSERFGEERPRLWLFFQNCANRVDATKMLVADINNVLQTKLVNCFRNNLAYQVSNELLTKAWAGNWIVMRAHLDLYLIELIETSDVQQLLQLVQDGAAHYEVVLDLLIAEAIGRQDNDGHLWETFLEKIEKAVEGAAYGADASKGGPKFSIFVTALKEGINSGIGAGSQELTGNISNNVSMFYSKFDDVLDWKTLKSDVCRKLGDIRSDLSPSSIREVVNLVKERMVKMATDIAGPRCAEMCPHCHLTCFLPTNHHGYHDTLHQPEGLTGISYFATHKLSSDSCADSVTENSTFLYDLAGIQTWVPFRDWSKYYTKWKIPTKGSLGSVAVREYIFAHYQEDLVEYSNTRNDETHQVKACTTIPLEYKSHEIGALRCQMESIIRST